MTRTSPLLSVVGLGVRYADAWPLRDCAFATDDGVLIGLVGANGAGKTTLLRAIAGLVRTAAGTVRVEGQDIAQLTDRERARRFAFVPQGISIEGTISVQDLVLQGRHPHLGRLSVEGERDLAIASLALRATESEPFVDRVAATLSAGERQRVVIARALAQEPKLLLLDEPTAHLDLRGQIEILDLLRRLVSGGRVVIAAIHDLGLAARWCDRLLVLRDGRLVADGPPTTVLTRTLVANAFGVQARIGHDPLTGQVEITGIRPSSSDARPKRGRVHVIAGGGRGASVIHRLASAGFDLTVGSLGEGDTDLQAAMLAGARPIVHRAFAPIDPELDAEHRALVAQADCVVIADICWGQQNLPNLVAALAGGPLIAIEGEPIGRRDFTGGAAAQLLAQAAPRIRTAAPASLVETVLAIISQEKPR